MADSVCRGYLICMKNSGEIGSRYPVTADSCLIGKHTECNLRIRDVDVNDRHCLIKISNQGNATIYCLCSEKPVLLNDVPVRESGSSLKNGDIVQILDLKFKWVENESFTDNILGRHSIKIENNLPSEAEQKRFSEPILPYHEENLVEEKKENEPQLSCNSYSAFERNVETKEISETRPITKLAINSSSVNKLISSCGTNRNNNRDSFNQDLNNSSKDVSQIRRSRLFSQTYKIKSATNSPENPKLTAAAKSHSKNTPLQENKRTPGREVKSRFLLNKNSPMKPATPLSFIEVREGVSVQEDEKGDDNLNTEVENIVPRNEKNVELKENTLENETVNEEPTFETTIPNDTVNAPSVLTTPKCFTKAFHSTPKAVELSKSEIELDLEMNGMTDITDGGDGTGRSNDPTQVFSLDCNSISALPVKSLRESDILCKKKKELEYSPVGQDSSGEIRRHHTRNTSNILKKTFEERIEDHMPIGENSLTTPEKSTTKCISSSRNPIAIVEELELERSSPEKKVDSRKSVTDSIKSPFESISELNAETIDAASFLSLEHRDKTQKYEDSDMAARCTRNLSYISPPENNRSQEYMDSVVVSTPKQQSVMGKEDVSDSFVTVTCTTPPPKQSGISAECMSTPKTPDSLTRHRRSTGIVPFVGTPSDVYRTTKGVLTPANKSRFNRTSMEVEVSMSSRDSLSGFVKASKFASKRSSSERKSTPLKADKSVMRDSLQMHSPILEEYALECEESQNESLNNDSQYKFVSKRRRRLAKSSFGISDRIMEESEVNQSDLSNEEEMEEEETVDDGEDSLVPLESFEDENSGFVSTRIVVNQTTDNDAEDALNSTYSLDTPEVPVDESELDSPELTKPVAPKSILTPLPRQPTLMREKSAKKVTFINLKEDSLNTDVSACTVTDADSEFDLQLSLSRVNTTSDLSSTGGENTGNEQRNDSEDERLYVSDKSSDVCSLDNTVESSGSIVQKIVAKRDKIVKRLSSARKSKSPRLSGVRRLLNPPKSPKCNYLNVSGVEQLMKTPEELVKGIKTQDMFGICEKMTEEFTESTKKPQAIDESSRTEKSLLKDAKSSLPLINYPRISELIFKEARTPKSHVKSIKALVNRQKTPAPFTRCTKTPETLTVRFKTPEARVERSEVPEVQAENYETPEAPIERSKTPEVRVECSNTPDTLAELSKTPVVLVGVSKTPEISVECAITVENISTPILSSKNEVCKSVPTSSNKSITDSNSTFATPTVRRCSKHLRIHRSSICLSLVSSLNSTLNETLSRDCSASLDNSFLEQKTETTESDVALPSESPKTLFNDVLIELKEKLIILQKNQANEDKETLEKSINIISEVLMSEPTPDTDIAVTEEAFKNVLLELKERFLCSRKFVEMNKSTIVTETDESRTSPIANDKFSILSQLSDNNMLEFACEETGEIRETSGSSSVEECIENAARLEEFPNSVSDVSKSDMICNNISGIVTSEIQTDISGVPESNEFHNDSSFVANTEEFSRNISEVTNSDAMNLEEIHCSMTNVMKFENALNITLDVTKSEEFLLNTPKFEIEQPALVRRENVSEAISELSQTNISVSEVWEEHHPLSNIQADVEELDSEDMELFLTDSDEVKITNKVIPISNETFTETSKGGSETLDNALEKSPTKALVTQELEKSSLSEIHAAEVEIQNAEVESCVAKIESKNSTIAANESHLVEENFQETFAGIESSSATNDSFKTDSIASNHELTVVDVKEVEKTSKMFDAIIISEKSKRFFDVSASLLINEEKKENLLSLTPVVDVKEKSTVSSPVIEKEKTPPPVNECIVKSQPSLLEVELCENIASPKKSISPEPLEEDAEKNTLDCEKTPVAVSEALPIEEDVLSILVTSSSYPSDEELELDTTHEENLSCIEPSVSEQDQKSAKSTSEGETVAYVIEETKMTITSSEEDEERTADVLSETQNTSQASIESLESSVNSEDCSTTALSDVSSSVSSSVALASVAISVPVSDVEMMITPPRCTAVCVSIEKVDQLMLAGPVMITQKARNSAQSISTSTPLCSAISQRTMEIPQSCSTTIITNDSPSVDEALDTLTRASGTIIDEDIVHSSNKTPVCPDSDESESYKYEPMKVSEVRNAPAAVETLQQKQVATVKSFSTDDNIEIQDESTSALRVPEEKLSSIAEEPLIEDETAHVPEAVAVINNEKKTSFDVAEESSFEDEVVAKTLEKTAAQNSDLSIVLEDIANDDLPVVEQSSIAIESSSKMSSTQFKTRVSNPIAKDGQVNLEKSLKYSKNDEEESARPKRGRAPNRCTESKRESSTQLTKRTKKNKNETPSSIMDVSVDLPKLYIYESVKPAIVNKRKTVHFDSEPEVKRSTRSRDARKIHIPTPKHSRTRTKNSSHSTLSPPASVGVDKFGSPCSIILSKIESDDENQPGSPTLKQGSSTRPKRITSSVKEEKRSRREPTDEVDHEKNKKNDSKTSKSTSKSKNKNDSVATNDSSLPNDVPVKEEKRSRRKAVEEVTEVKNKTDSTKVNKSGSKSTGKNENSKTSNASNLGEEIPPKEEKRSRRKANEEVLPKTKSSKGSSRSEDRNENFKVASDLKSSDIVLTKNEKRSRRKGADEVLEENKKDNNKVSKSVSKGINKNKESKTDELSTGVRVTRQKKVAESVVEVVELRKTRRGAKVDESVDISATDNSNKIASKKMTGKLKSTPEKVESKSEGKEVALFRTTRSRRDASQAGTSNRSNSKIMPSKIVSFAEMSRSKPTKRTASVISDSSQEVVEKRRKQSPNNFATRATRSRKAVVEEIVDKEPKVTLKRQNIVESENVTEIKRSKQIANSEEASSNKSKVSGKKKNNLSPKIEKSANTRAAKTKEPVKKKGNSVLPEARVTRSQNSSVSSKLRDAKK